MNLEFQDTNRVIGTLVVKSENTVITEDIGHVGSVDDQIIEDLTDVLISITEFKRQDKADFFYEVIKSKFSNWEIDDLISKLKEDEEN